MQRIATSTKAVDLFGAGKHGFTDGNPGTGIPATQLEAAWVNSLQEEIAAVIENAGVALNPAILTQLRDALNAKFQPYGRYTTTYTLSSNTTLTAAHVGAIIGVSSASTQTLPSAAAVPSGSTISFFATAGGVIVQRAGTDQIQPNGSLINSMAMSAGDTLVLESNGVSTWTAVGGSSQLGYAAAFASSLAAGGYQKLPGGLIIQWSNGTVTAAASANFSFPITFPNACLQLVASDIGGSTTPAGISPASTSQYTVFLPASGTKTFRMIAIGY